MYHFLIRLCTVLLLSSASIVGGGDPAAAFSGFGGVSISAGSCSGQIYWGQDGVAGAAVNVGAAYAGGTRWGTSDSGGLPVIGIGSGAQITVATLTGCGFFDVTIVSQEGVTATSPLTEAYIGIIWRARETAGGPLYEYQLAVSGVTSTVSIDTKELVDETPPTVAIAALSGPVAGVYTAAITLSEDSTDFELTDLTLTNATATLTGSGTSYSAELTPVADGPIALSVAVGTFSDAASNTNTAASNEVTADYDGTAPTVVLASATTSITGPSSFEVSVSFSETVTGFDASDIAVTNGAVASVTGAGAAYVVAINATGGGDVELSIPAAAATDAAGNGSETSNTLIIASNSVAETQKVIAQFLFARANQLLSSQPDLTGFLLGTGSGGFSGQVTRGSGSFDVVSNPNYPLWFRMSGSLASEGSRETDYVFGAFGSHITVNPNLLIGGLIEFDYLNQDEGSSSVKGHGWLAGPYFVARVPDQELYFEGRFLYGESSNDISPFGTYTDSFDSERLLAQLKVTGVLEHGVTRLFPSLAASYTSDDQKAYTDSLGNFIPKQGIELGQIELGMAFETPAPFYDGRGAMMLTGGIKGVGSFTNSSGNPSSVVPNYEGGRARIDLGLNYDMSNSGRFVVETFYDGIGANGYESYGMTLGFNLEF